MTPSRTTPDMNRYTGRFAARLRSLRIKSGLSQDDVAKALGVSVSAVYRWESGQNHPEPDLLPEIADTLGLPNVRILVPLR